MLRRLLRGYNWKSLAVLLLLAAVALAVGTLWRGLLRQNLGDVDALLILLWAVMGALLCWGVQPARDLALALVSLVAGCAFEWWGSTSHLWTYFTGEQPPLWILPAWPVAAMATLRLAQAVQWAVSGRRLNWRILYWVLVLGFTLGMIRFIWPALYHPATWAALAVMLLVIASGKDPRSDSCLFLAGSLLGFFLEYWGTRHECWTYYTQETPPLITAAAHGFAQLLYARVLHALSSASAHFVRNRPPCPDT